MDIYDLKDRMGDLLLQELKDEGADRVTSEDLGFTDPRSFYGEAWVTDDGIVVTTLQDRNLQYYGGYEYVDKEFRVVIGDYVYYSAEDERVAENVYAWVERVQSGLEIGFTVEDE